MREMAELSQITHYDHDNSVRLDCFCRYIRVLMAMKIEREYEKEDVLEFYVNGIYYGSGYYSIYDASKGYFCKDPKEMTDYECTLLVGIPNAPSMYSLNVRPDLAERRQEKVIECMVDVEYITEDEGNMILETGE